MARRSSSCELFTDEQQNLIGLRGHGSEAPIAEVSIPPTVTVELRMPDGQRVSTIQIDRGGRSADYEIAIHSPQIIKRLRVAGLTGHVTQSAER